MLLDPTNAGRADVVLLCTKAYQSEGAAPWLDQLAGPGTVVAVLQNGIDQVARIQPLAPPADIVPVVVMIAAEVLESGVIVQSSLGLLQAIVWRRRSTLRAYESNCEPTSRPRHGGSYCSTRSSARSGR